MDNTFLLGKGYKVLVGRFKELPDNFIKESRGNINISKRLVYGGNISASLFTNIARILGLSRVKKWTSFRSFGICINRENPK